MSTIPPNTGLVTPEATPEPEIRKIKENQQTQLAEQIPIKQPTTKDPSPGETGDNEDLLDKLPHDRLVKRIIGCDLKNPFRILGIADRYDTDDAERLAIRTSFWEIGMDIHPKYNRHKDAGEAFDKLIMAGKILCPQRVEKLQNWDGKEYSDDSSHESGMDFEEEIPYPPPNIAQMYHEATPYFTNLQSYPHARPSTRKINEINDRIRAINKQEGASNVERYTIKVEKVLEFYQQAGPIIKRSVRDEADELQNRLIAFLNKHIYPSDWRLTDAVLLREHDPKTKPTSTEQPATSAPKSTGASTSAGWRPGLTEKGERILAMAPTVCYDVNKNPFIKNCFFLVEQKSEKNPVVLMDSTEIGQMATNGYLHELPKEQQKDLRTKENKFSPQDQKGYIGIIGVAFLVGKNDRIFPMCIIWLKYKPDIGDKFVNRTGMRAVFRKQADAMIEDFLIDNDLEIPWSKRAIRPELRRRIRNKISTEETDESEGEINQRHSEYRTNTRNGRSPSVESQVHVSTEADSLATLELDFERVFFKDNNVSKFEELDSLQRKVYIANWNETKAKWREGRR